MSTGYQSNVSLPDKFVVNLPERFVAPVGPSPISDLTFERDPSRGGFVYLAARPTRGTAARAERPETVLPATSSSTGREEEMRSRTPAKQRGQVSGVDRHKIGEVEDRESVRFGELVIRSLPFLGAAVVTFLITQNKDLSSVVGGGLLVILIFLSVLGIRAWIPKSR